MVNWQPQIVTLFVAESGPPQQGPKMVNWQPIVIPCFAIKLNLPWAVVMFCCVSKAAPEQFMRMCVCTLVRLYGSSDMRISAWRCGCSSQYGPSNKRSAVYCHELRQFTSASQRRAACRTRAVAPNSRGRGSGSRKTLSRRRRLCLQCWR